MNVQVMENEDLKKELSAAIRNSGIYADWKTLAESVFESLTSGMNRLSELEKLLEKQTGDQALIKHAGVSFKIINNQRLVMRKTVVDKITSLYENNKARLHELMKEKSARREKRGA